LSFFNLKILFSTVFLLLSTIFIGSFLSKLKNFIFFNFKRDLRRKLVIFFLIGGGVGVSLIQKKKNFLIISELVFLKSLKGLFFFEFCVRKNIFFYLKL